MESIQLSADELSQKLDRILDEYCESKGIKTYKINNEGDEYLEMTGQQLKALTAQECGIGAFLIEQRALHIQIEYNKENGRANWAERTIALVIADKVNNYKGYSYVERSLQAIKEDSYASRLEKIRAQAKARASRLEHISTKLNNVSKTLIGLQYIKGGSQRGE